MRNSRTPHGLTSHVSRVALLLAGFAVAVGVVGFIAVVLRHRLRDYDVPAVLQLLRLRRFPVAGLLIVYVVVLSIVDRGSGFHDIRRYESDTLSAADSATIGQAWHQWSEAFDQTDGAQPMVFVAAQGGGLRAAVWTALVMECVFGPGPVRASGTVCAHDSGAPEIAEMVDRIDEPTPVLLASGASGGSVGLAAWSARRADLFADREDAKIPLRLEQALAFDFVAPVVARMFTADIPYALSAWDRADRAEMLERAWERAWDAAAATDAGDPAAGASRDEHAATGMRRGLRETWKVTHDDGAWATPVLALNGVSVEDGCRTVTSAVDFTLPRTLPDDLATLAVRPTANDDRPDDAACRGPERPTNGEALDILPSTSEIIDYLCANEDIPLSTAAHLSARFPYVSPTGRIARTGCADADGFVAAGSVSYDSDGGIFDNSGAATLTDTWRVLAPVVAAHERATGACVAPIVLQIDNSPPASTVSTGPDNQPAELLAPLRATAGQVTSRESYARTSAAAAFRRPISPSGRQIVGDDGAPETLWFRVSLFGQPGPEPPTGWTLATETVEDMRRQLRARQNAEQLAALISYLESGELRCENTQSTADASTVG